MNNNQELLSVADFLLILFKRKWIFLAVWVCVMALAVTYLLVAKKTYRLSGTIYVGRFQEILLEEGEFVAGKLQDYSFIKKALDNGHVQVDIPVFRLQKLVTTEVINEIKKTKDVGLVKLTVEYKDQEKVYRIFKALTDQLIADHQQLFSHSTEVFAEMERLFWEREKVLAESIQADETLERATNVDPAPRGTAPSHLLLSHTLEEKRQNLKEIIKDIHYIKIEGDSATKSFNTKLSAEPQIPDEHVKPRFLITLILGFIVATIGGVTAALLLNLYLEDVRPRLKKAD